MLIGTPGIVIYQRVLVNASRGHGWRYSLSSLDCWLQTCGASYSGESSVLILGGALQRTAVTLSETGARGGAAMEQSTVAKSVEQSTVVL